VLAIVASVLHLGNISFTHGDMDNAMLLDERSEDAMYIVAELMQVRSLTTTPLASCQ
jgi:myosin heavy subunit